MKTNMRLILILLCVFTIAASIGAGLTAESNFAWLWFLTACCWSASLGIVVAS